MASSGSAPRIRPRIAGAGLATAALLVATGCTARETLFIGIPEPATEEGILIEDLGEEAHPCVEPDSPPIGGGNPAAFLAPMLKGK